MTNTSYRDVRYIIIGIIGAILIIYGHFQVFAQTYYIIGALCLLSTAIYFRMLYFIALEIIIATGHTAVVLGVGPYTQFALPILLSVQLLIFYLMLGKENIIFLIIGIIGIALLSTGFAYKDNLVFLAGSAGVAVYAYYNALKGQEASYIWAVLNSIFIVLILFKMYFN